MYKNPNHHFQHKAGIIALVLLCFCFSFAAEASGKFNTSKRYLYVQPGQSIFSIVTVLYPDQPAQWSSVIKKIVRNNPHAFRNGDAAKIIAGKRLEIPSIAINVKPLVAAANDGKIPKAVGRVLKKQGKVFSVFREKESRDLQVESQVFVGDRVFTGEKGFVRLNMIDDAKIDLRCNSEMLIADYQMKQGNNRSVIHLLKGSVNKVTGSIGKMSGDVYEMHTPLATVGVRGTEYAIRVLQDHGCDGSVDVNSNGLFVKVTRGAIDVKTDKKEQALNKGDVAHMEDKNAELESIEVNDGIFEAVPVDNRKAGAVLWLLCLVPIVYVLRRRVVSEA
ncbi:hypothetical protein MNBD_GAMMA09-3084 [hydrothermal vent metagenome]|uniref:FecR protein domain-containing protein n=1 Tax=hydrothermal vent metagenome TaxID=652676 RepID=A0A3B0YEQ1_9ZZZZ